MQHIIFEENREGYSIALLTKTAAFNKRLLKEHYIDKLQDIGVTPNQTIAFDLEYGVGKKPTASFQKAYLQDLLPCLREQGVKYLLVTDSIYFKTLTKERKAEPFYGYALPCAIKGYEHFKVILAPNHQVLFYNPQMVDKIDLSLSAVKACMCNTYAEIGENVIHSAEYIYDPKEAAKWLTDILHAYPALSADIEAYSLKFWEAGIGTIGFAWDQHNGIVIDCDQAADQPNEPIRKLLKDFFESYDGTLIWHSANYDLKVIINELFMADLLDEKGKQYGIEVMTKDFHDTKLVTYLATNSTAGNELSLKTQCQEFLGNYAEQDIEDITLIKRPDLMEYNLKDCLGTWYVFNKHFQTIIEDKQIPVYEQIMKPSVAVILQMELTGMPIDMEAVKSARALLEADIERCTNVINESDIVDTVVFLLQEEEQKKANAKLKKKVKPLSDFDYITFNPNSNNHLIALLYDYLELPVLEKTKTGLPGVGGDTLKKLKNHTKNTSILELLNNIIDVLDANKILGTFVSAFEKAVLKADGHYYLHGNFNIGGTVSGRLSSSAPNLQNIPSTGNKYAKIIKACFKAPKGYLLMGADFASLEDRISALTTKDPNKLKVYEDGFDGHCLRAYYYFKDQCIGITEDVHSINKIKKLYPELRQISKAPTFLLTYGGTYHGLISNCGLSKDEAINIENRYHEMYKVSDEWVASKLAEASKTGYVTVAFGLRVRTPLLSQCFMDSRKTPYEAKAESRTAGNALGQSYGMLNNRAAIDLQQRTFKSPYRYDILPIAHIHDAQYFMVRDDVPVVSFLNQHLIECMEWQELDEIKHDRVKLGGELSLFHPHWGHEYEIPNGLQGDAIAEHIQSELEQQENQSQEAA